MTRVFARRAAASRGGRYAIAAALRYLWGRSLTRTLWFLLRTPFPLSTEWENFML